MKYILNISYDGSCFEGYQTQPHGKTVQDTLEKSLSKIFKQPIKTLASSRTDTGVHALCQLVMFEAPFKIPVDNLKKALNCTLTDAIIVNNVTENTNNKHVRYDVVNKTYKYIITKQKTPFNRNYAHCEIASLDVIKMQKEAQKFIGSHDFSSFCGSKTNVKSYIRSIYYIKIKEENNDLVIYINGSGFLYNMVRIMVSTLIEIGKNKDIDIEKIIALKDRTLAPPTAPAKGLYLHEINM